MRRGTAQYGEKRAVQKIRVAGMASGERKGEQERADGERGEREERRFEGRRQRREGLRCGRGRRKAEERGEREHRDAIGDALLKKVCG